MRGWNAIDAYLVAHGVRIGAPTLGQTTGGGHAEGSFHYVGMARDYGRGSDLPAVVAALTPLATGAGAPLAELFYTPTGTFLDNGKPITPSKKLADGHREHVHAAIRPTADLDPAATPAQTPPEAAQGAAGGGRDYGPLEGAAAAAGALLDPALWRRVALVAGGALVLILGVAAFARDAILPNPLGG